MLRLLDVHFLPQANPQAVVQIQHPTVPPASRVLSWLPLAPFNPSSTHRRTSCWLLRGFSWFCLLDVCFVLLFAFFFLKRAFFLMEDGLSEAGTDLDTVSFPAGPAQVHSLCPTKGCWSQAIKDTCMWCRFSSVRVCVTL